MITQEFIAEELQRLQEEICAALETEDGLGKFSVEKWKREEGGGGITRVMQHGNVIEKGGVNFSAVEGVLPEKIADALLVPAQDFFATGVSIVIHPYNPFVPIIHMNVRYFELSDGTYWFGGGIDLTPHYVDSEDAMFFHGELKKVCDRFGENYYAEFSKWADDYFFIRHRNETRGVGGIFFDRLMGEEHGGKEKLLEFILEVGRTFAPVYTHLVSKNRNKVFDEEHRQWQLIRRGRYVEFNLLYDKGTRFGLDTNGRIESILMSLPENASWLYNYVPAEGTEESRTLQKLKKGQKWA
ncbi:MAG TPA: oxygen-dependent coproporphyrinogen oxidase [Bacteroidia bacterium]|jgi:coproporphyrinogen III oxidase|nr:oxygen-dependent coproporphyrinogen oxidase [Bacteroidia bacterium]